MGHTFKSDVMITRVCCLQAGVACCRTRPVSADDDSAPALRPAICRGSLLTDQLLRCSDPLHQRVLPQPALRDLMQASDDRCK